MIIKGYLRTVAQIIDDRYKCFGRSSGTFILIRIHVRTVQHACVRARMRVLYNIHTCMCVRV